MIQCSTLYMVLEGDEESELPKSNSKFRSTLGFCDCECKFDDSGGRR